MAKQLSVIKLTGKIGDIVGMKNGFGTSASAFARKKAEVVSNPQSSTQMLQRIKMLPAVLVRRQLEEVIRRAWQGTKYGGQSMREFMKYAMKMPLSDTPQILKDSANPIPAPYVISKGSLRPIVTTYLSANSFNTNLPFAGTDNDTLGKFSLLLMNNGIATAGDQFTIVVCTLEQGFAVWRTLSFFVDEGQNVSWNDFFENFPVEWDEIDNQNMAIVAKSDYTLVACACVLSREGSTPLRSSATLAVDKTALAAYFGSTIKADVLASYKTASSSSRTNTDWPYDEGADIPVETVDGEYTLSGLTGAAATKNGTKVKVKFIAGTEELYAVYAYTNENSPLVGSQPFCVGTNGQPVSYTDGDDETGLSVSAVAAFAGLRQIAVS